jgi:glucose uptake protein GlcU
MNPSLSRRIAEHLLMVLLPREYRDALIGDLREDAVTSLYWREVLVAVVAVVIRMLVTRRNDDVNKEDVMATIGTATRRPVAFTLSLGVLGGGALITTAAVSHRGWFVFLPYATIVVLSAVILRAETVRPFLRRFLLSLGAFMIATLIFYVFMRTVPRERVLYISVIGHAWRIGFMLVIGSVLSTAVAQLTATIGRTPELPPRVPQ